MTLWIFFSFFFCPTLFVPSWRLRTLHIGTNTQKWHKIPKILYDSAVSYVTRENDSVFMTVINSKTIINHSIRKIVRGQRLIYLNVSNYKDLSKKKRIIPNNNIKNIKLISEVSLYFNHIYCRKNFLIFKLIDLSCKAILKKSKVWIVKSNYSIQKYS